MQYNGSAACAIGRADAGRRPRLVHRQREQIRERGARASCRCLSCASSAGRPTGVIFRLRGDEAVVVGSPEVAPARRGRGRRGSTGTRMRAVVREAAIPVSVLRSQNAVEARSPATARMMPWTGGGMTGPVACAGAAKDAADMGLECRIMLARPRSCPSHSLACTGAP